MPWKEVLPMEEKYSFILKYNEGLWSVTELCREYSISRKTAYKLINRYQAHGFDGLKDRSRRPKHCPHGTSGTMIQKIVDVRRNHYKWGGKKIRRILLRDSNEENVPAESTIDHILGRLGMTKKRRRRRNLNLERGHLTEAICANDVWCVDFKGWFKVGNGKVCYPLTVTDLKSRYILSCQVLPRANHEHVYPVFERLFKSYGLPKIIRSDNGAPFATVGVCGLSRLSCWWLHLGIKPELIEPGHPEQNGAHERMHRTLKQDTIKPPANSLRSQQRRFDEWRECFNKVRPHEALNMDVPSSYYSKSPRKYNGRWEKFDYPKEYVTRKIKRSGEISFDTQLCYIGQALEGAYVGLKQVESFKWNVYLGSKLLGELQTNAKLTLKSVTYVQAE